MGPPPASSLVEPAQYMVDYSHAYVQLMLTICHHRFKPMVLVFIVVFTMPAACIQSFKIHVPL